MHVPSPATTSSTAHVGVAAAPPFPDDDALHAASARTATADRIARSMASSVVRTGRPGQAPAHGLVPPAGPMGGGGCRLLLTTWHALAVPPQAQTRLPPFANEDWSSLSSGMASQASVALDRVT